jgi:hypothetical protein
MDLHAASATVTHRLPFKLHGECLPQESTLALESTLELNYLDLFSYQVKRSIYDLPDARFIYGMINPRDAEGVKEGESAQYQYYPASTQE